MSDSYMTEPYKDATQCETCGHHLTFDELLRADRMGTSKKPQGYSILELKGMGLNPHDRVCRYCGTLIVKMPEES
jgi:hypothetical protein